MPRSNKESLMKQMVNYESFINCNPISIAKCSQENAVRNERVTISAGKEYPFFGLSSVKNTQGWEVAGRLVHGLSEAWFISIKIEHIIIIIIMMSRKHEEPRVTTRASQKSESMLI